MDNLKIVLPVKQVKVIADVNSRFIAYLIDVIIFFFMIYSPFTSLLYSLSGLPFEELTVEQLTINSEFSTIIIIGYFSSMLIFAFYLISFDYLINGSIGKRMMGLSTISKKGKLKLKQLILRNLLKSVFVTFLFFDCFLMFFDREKRRVTDFLANTLVVSNKKIIKKFPVVNEI